MLKLIVFQLILYLSHTYTTAQPKFISRVCQDTFGNYTANSPFKKNLDTLLSTIVSNTNIDYGFYNFSVGTNLDIVNGIGLCSPELPVHDCRSCLSNAARAIVHSCPNQKDAIGWYDSCMIRYSNRYIFHKLEFGPWYKVHYPILRSIDKGLYNKTASTLLTKLQARAAFGNSLRKFAADKANVTSDLTVYAIVQCTPDLESFDCYSCLGHAIATYYQQEGQQARLFFTSCNIRLFHDYMLYDLSSLNSLLPQTQGKASKKWRVFVQILLPIIASLLILAAIFGWYFSRKRSKLKNRIKHMHGNKSIRDPESLQMKFATIRAATGNFSITNKLGKGGFGAVYKGRLPNGQTIAVKRLLRNCGQGEEEFKNEAALVARLQHRNLVKFFGFCLEGEERLLIYELLPNRSLDFFLFDPAKHQHLDWQTRFKIIRGIARGLVYLHEDSRLLVVHRDLKSGNILLDGEMNPKIADFGMARLFGVNQTQGDTRKICGTYGYMPPEYVNHGHFSFKSDVFSFGVLLLEIITSLRIGSFYHSERGETLLSFAWRNWLEGNPLNIMDKTMPLVNNAEVLRCINVGLLCVQHNIAHRPSMSLVVLMLNSHTITPPMPSRPAFLLDNNAKIDRSNSNVSLQVINDESANKVTISEVEAR